MARHNQQGPGNASGCASTATTATTGLTLIASLAVIIKATASARTNPTNDSCTAPSPNR